MSIHASTVLTQSPSAILAHVSRLSKLYPDYSLLFTLSPNVHAQDLSKLVKRLTTFSSQTTGCLSAPLPGQKYSKLIACSLAVFDPEKSVIFRSTIAGKEAPQVGRWHAFRKKDDVVRKLETPEGEFNWGDVWDRRTSESLLPTQLQHLNTNEVNEVVFLSDTAPEGLSNSLVAFTNATKLGLIATSTPFITGRPVTLFHNESIYESGAVGIALSQYPNSQAKARSEFVGFIPLSPMMAVTRCEGNMINTLDNLNPTQLLLNAIRRNGMNIETSASFKDDEKFCLGTIKSGKLGQMYNITAGDPSRGNISLESQSAPSVGTQVQFFHRPKSSSIIIPEPSSVTSRTMTFITSPDPPSPPSSDKISMESDAFLHPFPNAFIASSENGFVMSRSGDENEAAWTCTMPGGLASLEWE